MAPSPVDYLGRTPSEMSGGDIEEVVKDFEKAAYVASLVRTHSAR